MTYVRRAWMGIALVCGSAVACAPRNAIVSHVTPDDVPGPRVVLLEALRRRAGEAAFDTARVRFVADSSAIPGVRYLWGMYNPPGSSLHLVFVSVVATRDGVSRVIRSPGDWHAAVGRSLPEEPQAAVAAFGEAVHTTPRSLYPGARLRVYTGPASLENLWFVRLDPRERKRLEARVSPPVVTRAEGSWSASFWALEAEGVTRYACRLSADSFVYRKLKDLREFRPRDFR